MSNIVPCGYKTIFLREVYVKRYEVHPGYYNNIVVQRNKFVGTEIVASVDNILPDIFVGEKLYSVDSGEMFEVLNIARTLDGSYAYVVDRKVIEDEDSAKSKKEAEEEAERRNNKAIEEHAIKTSVKENWFKKLFTKLKNEE